MKKVYIVVISLFVLSGWIFGIYQYNLAKDLCDCNQTTNNNSLEDESSSSNLATKDLFDDEGKSIAYYYKKIEKIGSLEACIVYITYIDSTKDFMPCEKFKQFHPKGK